MFKVLLTVIHHEILTTLRQAHTWITPILFFIIVVCLFPLAIGPDTALLHTMAPGIIWIAALLAIVMSIANLFTFDSQDGYLDLLLLSSIPFTLLVTCKIMSHWLTHCFPLIIISPILGLILGLNAYEQAALISSLLLGTPVLSLLGAIGAALIVGIRSHSLLLPILIMPLYIPILIFGTGTIIAATAALPITGYLAIMGAFNLMSMVFAPFLTGLALRNGVNQ